MLSGCGAKDSPRSERGDDCQQESSVNGAKAFNELDTMIDTIRIGTRCQLAAADRVGAYQVQAGNGKTLSLEFETAGAATPSAFSANRTACNGVPYWRAESSTVLVDGQAGTFLWEVREDVKQTVRFQIRSAGGPASVDARSCD